MALFALYGWAIIPYTYLLSHAFSSHSSAQNVSLLVNVRVVMLMIVSMIMGLGIDSPVLCQTDQGLKYVWRVAFPGFNLGNGLYALASLNILPSLNANCNRALREEVGQLVPYHALDTRATGANLICLATQGAIFFVLCIVLDLAPCRWRTPLGHLPASVLGTPTVPAMVQPVLSGQAAVPVPQVYEPQAAHLQSTLDADVLREQERRHSTAARHAALVCISNVWKRYGDKVAVRDLTLGIGATVVESCLASWASMAEAKARR